VISEVILQDNAAAALATSDCGEQGGRQIKFAGGFKLRFCVASRFPSVSAIASEALIPVMTP